MMDRRFAFIMRGVPGSFKSTTAKYLAGDTGVIHAVDDLHTHDGVFLWDEDREEQRYQENFELFRESCRRRVPVVVCDCMNLTKKDYQKYIDEAQGHGYIACTVGMQNPSSDVAASRNEHDVTEVQIREMLERWED